MTFSQEDAGLSATQFSSEPPVGLVADSPRDAKSLLAAILASLDDAKAEEVVDIDVAAKTPIADHMVICTGRSSRHVGAIADHLVKDLKDAGFGTVAVEGQPTCDWVLIDAGSIVVHVFRPEVREFYQLEKMWMPTDQLKALRTDTAAH